MAQIDIDDNFGNISFDEDDVEIKFLIPNQNFKMILMK